jgi:hypothetical protein
MPTVAARPIVYLASYPRSGNTFLRALLANFDSGLDRPLSVEEVGRYGMGEKGEIFWRLCTGAAAKDRTLEMEWQARPAYFALTRQLPGEGPVMFKTHTLNGLVLDRPAFEIRPEDRIVYIVRHPLDVLISATHFYDLSSEAMAERMVLSGAFNNEGGVAPFEVVGSWIENVSGWLTETRCPIMLVRYRDLCFDTAGQLANVLNFIGRPATSERVRAAVAFSNFEWLQHSHADEGFDQGPLRDRMAPFFRVGLQDQWKQDLPRDLAVSLSGKLGELMDVFGYERP